MLSLVASIIFIPAFFVTFCLLYNPFDIIEYYSFGSLSYSFHLTMLGCIILVTLVPTRILLHLSANKYSFRLSQHLLWCVGEIFICACFMALYTHLFRNSGTTWFHTLATCLKFAFLILCYPVVIISMAWQLTERKKDGETKETDSSDDNLVKLYDEHKRLKLTISPASILYVRAESNYVNIYYLDSGRPKEYLLRSSMKSAEESLSGFGLARCHRSFLVNPKHVSMLGKADDGFTYATLDTPDTPKIPVSKQYCDSLSELL